MTGEKIEQQNLDGLELTQAFAFAFWGGDFYFLTKNDEPTYPKRSKVTRLDYDGDGSLTTINNETPIRVVGAGVSIRAPLIPPA